jgi:hypothetical protein
MLCRDLKWGFLAVTLLSCVDEEQSVTFELSGHATSNITASGAVEAAGRLDIAMLAQGDEVLVTIADVSMRPIIDGYVSFFAAPIVRSERTSPITLRDGEELTNSLEFSTLGPFPSELPSDACPKFVELEVEVELVHPHGATRRQFTISMPNTCDHR